MSETMTLADVATRLDVEVSISVSNLDRKLFSGMAATVRAASELLGRCIPLIEQAMQFPTYCESRNLLADIRAIRGGGGQ